MAPFHPVGQNPTLAIERDLDLIVHLSASIWFVVRYIYNQIRQSGGPKVISTWGGAPTNQVNPYKDREFQPTIVSNGWGAPLRQYKRFGR